MAHTRVSMPKLSYNYNETIDVSVTAADKSNPPNHIQPPFTYRFYIAQDTLGPVITPVSPTAGQKEVLLNTPISFTVVDDRTGVANVELYIDENPISYLVGTGVSTESNYFRFGDGSEGSTVGSLYDWIIWDVSGAYAPGTGNPLPEELTGLPSAIEEINTTHPADFILAQNYPNPFNPVTEIKYTINKTARIVLTIYDNNGRIVNNLVNDIKSPGIYNVRWDGCDQSDNLLPSGVYFYSMEAGNNIISKKMILLR